MKFKCPDCAHKFTLAEIKEQLTDDDLRALWAARNSALRRNPSGGRSGGRPRATERCPCGRYSLHSAQLLRHVCQAPPPNDPPTEPTAKPTRKKAV